MLKDIVVVRKPIPVNGKDEFEVRGLTLTDLGQLIQEYKTPLGKLMDSKLDIHNIADQYPEFMAKVVALAAEEKDEWEKVMALPFTSQLYAFEAVWDLTIPDYKALGKLVERIKGIIQQSQASKGSK